jgi:methylated-DNA-[protein]-cysteine S-methyltransferase
VLPCGMKITDHSLETIETLLAEMRADPAAFPDVRSVVRRSGYGTTRLCDLFRRHYQAAPADLLLRARIDLAKSRLRASDAGLVEIAGAVGFESLSVFHEQFRRLTGVTPAAYRSQPPGRRNSTRPLSSAPMTFTVDTIPTPLGEFSVAVDRGGAVATAVFGDEKALRERMRDEKAVYSRGRAEPARMALTAYFAGQRLDFSLPVAPAGSAFQQRVWKALQAIPSGETRSYGEIAAQLGSSPRAVGRAIGSNPVCLFIPCHRVIGADGSLTGYAFGVDLKRRLLAHEAPRRKPPVSPGL